MNALSRSVGKKMQRVYLDGSRRVLLAHENEELREELARDLRGAGYAVTEVEDGREAEDYLKWAASRIGSFSLPAVIIAEAIMSGGDGLEVLAHLREARSTTPVIVLNSMADPNIERAAHELSATFVLDGPFDSDDLQAAVYLAVTSESSPSSDKKSTDNRQASSQNFEVPANAHTSTISASRNGSGDNEEPLAADSVSLG